MSENQRGEILLTDYVRSISTGGGKPGAGYPAVVVPISMDDATPSIGATSAGGVLNNLAVRRLTPLERERLMGWPDDWTEWGVAEDGTRVEMPDTTRNRMTGNGVVTPIAEWIAGRLAAAADPVPPSPYAQHA